LTSRGSWSNRGNTRLNSERLSASNVLKRDEKQMLKSLKSLEAIVSLSVGDDEAKLTT
jgi:hypothetical protein